MRVSHRWENFVGFDFACKDGGGVTVGFIGFGFLIGCVFLGLRGFDCWFCVIVGFAGEDL